MNRIFAIIWLFCSGFLSNLTALEPSDIWIPTDSDTCLVFKSSDSLISPIESKEILKNNWGINLALSGNGFGMGTSFDFGISENFSLSAAMIISGARNTDEFEIWDGYLGEYRVPGKINRLFLVPITLGAKYYVLTSVLTDNFKPYLSTGAGLSWIISTPYEREFFNAFHHSQSFLRFTGFIGIGSDFGVGKALLSVNLKQYFIPFGGDGLESVINHPLTDFGGFQIDILMGIKY